MGPINLDVVTTFRNRCIPLQQCAMPNGSAGAYSSGPVKPYSIPYPSIAEEEIGFDSEDVNKTEGANVEDSPNVEDGPNVEDSPKVVDVTAQNFSQVSFLFST